MTAAGIDVGSLTAKAVIMRDGLIIAHSVIRAEANPLRSAEESLGRALKAAGMSMEDIDACCSTGYGREEIPFAQKNVSEISCHGAGAFWMDKNVRTVVDIGGQDCKVISLDGRGAIVDFIMNDKCAAGTGRSLELLSRTLGVSLEELGSLALKSKRPAAISNKCSIFMELEVLQHVYQKRRTADIAAGIAEAVAKRVGALMCQMEIKSRACITGGVSKNPGVVKYLENLLSIDFIKLPYDPQVAGAIGAALFASDEAAR
jgi:predicted CoA-substrate-specific enzyme activase